MKRYRIGIILLLIMFTLTCCEKITIPPINKERLKRTGKEKETEVVPGSESLLEEKLPQESPFAMDNLPPEDIEDNTEDAAGDTISTVLSADDEKKSSVSSEVVTGPLYATVPLNLRSGPGTSYSIIGALNKGDEITVIGKKKNWYEITFGKGTAYVHSKYFTKDRSSVVTPEGLYDVEPDYDTFVGQVLKLVNDYRLENGLKALKLDSRLIQVAELRAKEIETLFSHERPDGRNCLTAFVDTRNTDFTYCGENIAQGYSSAQAVFDAWVASEPHRENILNPSFKRIGMAIWKDTYISQEFSD